MTKLEQLPPKAQIVLLKQLVKEQGTKLEEIKRKLEEIKRIIDK